ncbi:hypothetical protein SAMN05660443_0992 [Marinospirillum celere]|uniref:TRAP transporter solute receptor, TAXI family n=1 Tax=Marinospirillum celere TaxID=1122252 RepID=A0A1I1FMS4_9GAMM|nr:TAXI family TRAP transporter solute-binding subunit [Marinospirillum celere]SFB98330.1 hypothetical protein SAMN05660443_0992 [Marinospirillum celere]
MQTRAYQGFKGHRHLLVAGLLYLPLVSPPTLAGTERLAFSSGPDGGTFEHFARGISSFLSDSNPRLEVLPFISAGSIENLRRINGRDAEFGIVYATDLYLGSQGRLTNDTRIYRNIQALSSLYPAPAQLIVPRDSDIHQLEDLKGKRLAIGGIGSGSAAFAERYFQSLGLWQELRPRYLGYSHGAEALLKGEVDALFILAGLPTPAVTDLAKNLPVRLLQTYPQDDQQRFFSDHPYYTETLLPAGSYPGIDQPVPSFQDMAILVAGVHVDQELVLETLNLLYLKGGTEVLKNLTPAAQATQLEKGLTGLLTPLHPGARHFWQFQGYPLEAEPEP